MKVLTPFCCKRLEHTMRCIDEIGSEQGQSGSPRQACELVFLRLN